MRRLPPSAVPAALGLALAVVAPPLAGAALPSGAAAGTGNLLAAYQGILPPGGQHVWPDWGHGGKLDLMAPGCTLTVIGPGADVWLAAAGAQAERVVLWTVDERSWSLVAHPARGAPAIATGATSDPMQGCPYFVVDGRALTEPVAYVALACGRGGLGGPCAALPPRGL